MLIRVYKMKTMEELLRKCAKKNLPNSKHFLGKGDQASGLVFKEDEYKVITEDIQEVSPSQLVAWIFSCPYIRQFETDVSIANSFFALS